MTALPESLHFIGNPDNSRYIRTHAVRLFGNLGRHGDDGWLGRWRLRTLKLRGMSVLLVEDDADTSEALRVMLESEGASVTSVPGSRAALKAVQQSPPDVVISDIALPDENGHTFLRELRSLSRERGGRIPAVALTAYTSREARLESRESGFHYHLEKPVDADKLVNVLADLVRLTRR